MKNAEVIQSIVNSLGLEKSAMLIREIFASKTDYLVQKNELFGNLSVDAIYQDMKNWKKKKGIPYEDRTTHVW